MLKYFFHTFGSGTVLEPQTLSYVLTLHGVSDRANYFVTGRCSSGFSVSVLGPMANTIKRISDHTGPCVLTLHEVNDRENFFVTGRCSSGFNCRPNG